MPRLNTDLEHVFMHVSVVSYAHETIRVDEIKQRLVGTMANISELERAIRIYKATYDVTDEFFLDVLGISSRTTWKNLRSGKREFSAKHMYQLSKVLAVPMEELYAMLPAINHEEA